jgi:ubiquinone/menaquinone biosynthesis C-methylase UbiE
MAYVFLGIAGLLAFIFLGWRMASHRHALPCPVWLRWMVELDNPFTRTNRAATILEHLDLQPGMTVLDAGCGPGRLTIPLAQRVGDEGDVLALDLQPGMLDRVRAKAEAAGVKNIRFLQAAIGDGKLETNRFDRVLLVTVLGEIPDRPAALKELFEATKPGGVLSVTEVIFDPHFQRYGTVARLAKSVGFRETTRHGNSLAYTLILEKPADAR